MKRQRISPKKWNILKESDGNSRTQPNKFETRNLKFNSRLDIAENRISEQAG